MCEITKQPNCHPTKVDAGSDFVVGVLTYWHNTKPKLQLKSGDASGRQHTSLERSGFRRLTTPFAPRLLVLTIGSNSKKALKKCRLVVGGVRIAVQCCEMQTR